MTRPARLAWIMLGLCAMLALKGEALDRAALKERPDPISVSPAGKALPDSSRSMDTFTGDAVWRTGIVRTLEAALHSSPPWDAPPAAQRQRPAHWIAQTSMELRVRILSVHEQLENDVMHLTLPAGFASSTQKIEGDDRETTVLSAILDVDSTLEMGLYTGFAGREMAPPQRVRLVPGLDTVMTFVTRYDGEPQMMRARITSAARAGRGVDVLRAGDISLHRFVGARLGIDVDSTLVRTDGRYTFVVVASQTSIADRVRATRLDSMVHVGAFSPDGRFLAVAANNHAPIMLAAGLTTAKDEYRYRVYTAGSDDPDDARLLVMLVLGYHFTDDNETPLRARGADIERTASWLLRVFDTSIRRADVDSLVTLDTALARQRDALMRLTHW